MTCSPASVGETLRLVRVGRRTPICSSSRRIAWLNPDVEMFSRFAARVKPWDLFFTHVRLHGGRVPVRRYMPHLIDLVLNGRINPARCSTS